jgi:hypothetical protein
MRRPWPYAIVLAPVVLLLVHWARLLTMPLPVGFATPEADPTAGHVVSGAFHVHTTASDGRADVDTVARAAAAAGLDFVMLADHNIEPPAPDRRHGVVLVPGVELSTSVGHLLAVGATRLPSWRRRLETPVDSARFAGGVAILGHPVNRKHPWTGDDWNEADGMEVLSGDSLFRDALARPFSRMLPALVAMPVSREIGLLSLIHRPDAAFEAWDAHPGLIGVCAHDAHGYEGYEAPFSVMQLRLRVPAPLPEDPAEAVAVLVAALGSGEVWCSLGGLLDPAGFRFGLDEAGGIEARLAYVEWPERVRPAVVIHRDGVRVAEGSHEARVAPAPPGIYRAEVHLDVPWTWGRRTFPWIFTSGLRVEDPDPS